MIKRIFSLSAGMTFGLLFIILTSPAQQKQQPAAKKTTTTTAKSKASAKSVASYKIIEAPGNTWCYDIFVDNRMMIHQPSVPGLPGNKGFNTQADAAKVARLVMHKIQHNQMPPTVSKHEMDSLKVKM